VIFNGVYPKENCQTGEVQAIACAKNESLKGFGNSVSPIEVDQ
jgi:hypothetical protein